MGKSKNPTYPDADPTAPGGMSKAALIRELVDKHGYIEKGPDGVTGMRWPDMIDLVCAERLEREREAKAEQSAREVAQVTAERYGADVFSREDEHEEQDAAVNDYDQSYYDEREDAGYEAEHPDDEDIDALLNDLDEALDEQAERIEEQKATSLLHRVPGTLDYIFNGHMGAGPSASERWINCTASLGASLKFLETLTPNQQAEFAVANESARQGTTAHAVGESELLALLGRISEEELDNTLLDLAITPPDGEAYDEDMAEYVREYTDLMSQYAAERGDDHVLVEQRVSAVVPLVDLHEGETYEVRGSADGVALPTEDEPDLVVADLKYGNGIDVDVDSNPQLRIYALGVLDQLLDDEGNLITPVDTITYYIVQPRLGGIKQFSESLDALLDWRDEVLSPALTKALYGINEGAAFAPSESACQWCPARGQCSALAEVRIASAQDLFDVVADVEENPFDVGVISENRLGELLAQAKMVHDIYDDLKAEAQRRLYRGEAVPGFHLVNYTPPRYWREDADSALDPMLHRDEGALLPSKIRAMLWKDPTLMTPTQALAILKKNGIEADELNELIIAPDKKPVVAPVTDRRSKWEGRAPEDMFADESEAE